MNSYKIILNGWIEDCKTITAIKLIRGQLNMELGEAKDCIDRVLEDEFVVLPREFDFNSADSLREQLVSLGIKCDLKNVQN